MVPASSSPSLTATCRRFAQLPSDYAAGKSQQDLQNTWDWFCDLPAFFDRAEKAGRHVLFTVDQ